MVGCLIKVADIRHPHDVWFAGLAGVLLPNLKYCLDHLPLFDYCQLVTDVVCWRFTVTIEIVMRFLRLLTAHRLI
jgi:hypothetical protein